MRKTRKLSPVELSELLRAYHETRKLELRDRIIEAHLYIAEIIARKFSGRGVDSDDLFQVAALALTKAVERYDPERGIQFASYATPGMVGEVKNYFRDKSRLIRPPRRASELARIVDVANEKLTQELGRSPRVQEIAAYTELSEDEVLEALELSHLQPVSLNTQTDSEDEEMNLQSLLGEEDRGFREVEDKDRLSRAMNALSPAQREVISLRFFENLSQREAALRMGVSQMTVSRHERSALEALRSKLGQEDS